MANDNSDFFGCHVLSAKLETHRDALFLSFSKLVTWIVRVLIVHGHTKPGPTQLSCDLVSLRIEHIHVVFLLANRDNDELYLCHLRRQDKSLVVRVDHDHGTD